MIIDVFEVKKEIRVKKLLIAAALVALAGSTLAQDVLRVEALKVFKPDALTWKANPMFPNGAQTVLLVGDPSKPGAFVLYTKFPANYRVPPHTHPFSEVVTIISGSMGNGMGEKFDPQKGEMLKAGSLLALPANHAHYVWTGDEEVIVQIEATGPWGITYINPADDPRKKTN
jgi:quercetin dioxygenase-like cupin family protein